jgi:hypothetical protein
VVEIFMNTHIHMYYDHGLHSVGVWISNHLGKVDIYISLFSSFGFDIFCGSDCCDYWSSSSKVFLLEL